MPTQKLLNIFDINAASWYRQQKKINLSVSDQETISARQPKGASVQRRYSEEHRKKVLAEINKPENADYSVR